MTSRQGAIRVRGICVARRVGTFDRCSSNDVETLTSVSLSTTPHAPSSFSLLFPSLFPKFHIVPFATPPPPKSLSQRRWRPRRLPRFPSTEAVFRSPCPQLSPRRKILLLLYPTSRPRRARSSIRPSFPRKSSRVVGSSAADTRANQRQIARRVSPPLQISKLSSKPA